MTKTWNQEKYDSLFIPKYYHTNQSYIPEELELNKKMM